MSDRVKPVINLADVPLRDMAHGERYGARVGSFGGMIGSTSLGAMLHVVEPGRRAFPFHAHHVIGEVFVILEGEGEYRFGDAVYPVRAGDVCAAPAGGPETAHQIVNTGAGELRYLGISTIAGTEVVEYPDSGKFAVTSRYDWATGKGGVRMVARAGDGRDYWEGE